MRRHIEKRFNFNKQRVQRLIDSHLSFELSSDGTSKWYDDILRAAVVLLHATLEDLIRGLMELRAGQLSPAFLETIPFGPLPHETEDRDERKLKGYGFLARFRRDKSVDVLLTEAVKAYLARSNFNNIAQVKEALAHAAIVYHLTDEQGRLVSAAMNRRHQIVHQSDRLERGSNHGYVRSIKTSEVEAWLAAISRFGDDVLKEVTPKNSTKKKKIAIRVPGPPSQRGRI